MEPNGPVMGHLVPFVHSQNYKQIRVHLDPNIHHLAGYPLGLPQGPLGVPGPHFENQQCRPVAGLYLRGGHRLMQALFRPSEMLQVYR